MRAAEVLQLLRRVFHIPHLAMSTLPSGRNSTPSSSSRGPLHALAAEGEGAGQTAVGKDYAVAGYDARLGVAV